MTHKIESEWDRASKAAGGLMPVAAGDGCPTRARYTRRAVAPHQRGEKATLRARHSSLGRYHVQVKPRPACSFLRRFAGAIDWGYLGFVAACTATLLLALHVALGGGL